MKNTRHTTNVRQMPCRTSHVEAAWLIAFTTHTTRGNKKHDFFSWISHIDDIRHTYDNHFNTDNILNYLILMSIYDRIKGTEIKNFLQHDSLGYLKKNVSYTFPVSCVS